MFTFYMDRWHQFFFICFLLTQDISQKLGMLQEEYDNATAMTRTLAANLTGKNSHIREVSNDDLIWISLQNVSQISSTSSNSTICLLTYN